MYSKRGKLLKFQWSLLLYKIAWLSKWMCLVSISSYDQLKAKLNHFPIYLPEMPNADSAAVLSYHWRKEKPDNTEVTHK